MPVDRRLAVFIDLGLVKEKSRRGDLACSRSKNRKHSYSIGDVPVSIEEAIFHGTSHRSLCDWVMTERRGNVHEKEIFIQRCASLDTA